MAPTKNTISALESENSALKIQNSQLLEKLQEALEKLSSMDSRINESMLLDGPSCQNDLEAIKTEFKNFRAELTEEIHKVTTRITSMEDRCTILSEQFDDLEQYSRRNCLLIHGLPEKKNKDGVALACGVFQSIIRAEVPPYVIDRAHRIGQLRDSKCRPLIVKFVSYQERALIWRSKRLLKGLGIVITESLTGTRVKLLKEAKELHGKSNVWTCDGKIVILGKNGRRSFISNSRELKQFHSSS